MAPPRQINIAVIGAGGVGSCFLSQLAWLAKNQKSTRLSLCYIATIDGALYSQDYADINIETALPTLEAKGYALPSVAETIEYLAGAPHKVILVDNTSSGAIAEAYPEFLRRGVSIITPNKKAFSGSYELWQDIFSAAQSGGSMVYHESSVGAGMPVISTLKELVQTGDEVTRIEGVFSGTMSFLFNQFSPTTGQAGKWSETVKKAKELGYTEPDPRDDLNGLDVARKLTILGRLAGLPIESPASFPVQSLIPEELNNCATRFEFLSRLHEFDDRMENKKYLAKKAGKVLRYVGSIEMGTRNVKVGMEMFDPTHAIAALKGSDNIISFYTKRYGEMPLTIRGAGAGGDVTAMGVTGDLLKILCQMS
ncbi:homoserine dehydrogenase-domain-containing protein [Penicillium daleae]|uniref:Homoserine dehydrogenase n=1 Tax=Penicillium daleae TaxID=63821 RepID=A0AAD6CGK0_9EURO|nr:homoserine dehydrogenase-domain-containing protein [Penicillium daleae]KAJ5464971.1 homoserine dehydrogenase-domain-containing protein [Penicillium daleae]